MILFCLTFLVARSVLGFLSRKRSFLLSVFDCEADTTIFCLALPIVKPKRFGSAEVWWNMGVSRQIKAKIDYSDLSPQEFATRAEAFYAGLLENEHFPTPPQPLSVFRAWLDDFQAIIVSAIDSKMSR